VDEPVGLSSTPFRSGCDDVEVPTARSKRPGLTLGKGTLLGFTLPCPSPSCRYGPYGPVRSVTSSPLSGSAPKRTGPPPATDMSRGLGAAAEESERPAARKLFNNWRASKEASTLGPIVEGN
jgi:hypothetical protein